MAPEKADDPPAPIASNKDEDAVVDEDDDDLDDALAELQRIQSAKRREGKEKNQKNRIQEILPFPFAPNIRPLGISDLHSAVALENAAFSDPRHRASKEKVGTGSAYSALFWKQREAQKKFTHWIHLGTNRPCSSSTALPSVPS